MNHFPGLNLNTTICNMENVESSKHNTLNGVFSKLKSDNFTECNDESRLLQKNNYKPID